MIKFHYYFLNCILFLALVGGALFCAPSIKGFCSEVNVSNQSIEYFTLSCPDPSTYPSDLNYTCEVTFPSSLSFKCSIVPSTTTSSCTYYYGVLLHVVTTNGDYVVRVSDGSFSTVPPQPGNSKTVNNSLGLSGLGTYTFPGYFIQSYIEYTSDGKIWRSGSNTLSGTLNSNTGSFNGTWAERSGEFPSWSVSSVNGTNVSYTNVQSASGDYMQILTQIYNELLDQGITLDNLYTELFDQGLSLDNLVSSVRDIRSSVCYDFPLSIDGNFQLASCFFIPSLSSFSSLSFYHYIDYFAFSFDSVSSYTFYGTVPESRVIRIYLSPYASVGSFYSANGTVLNPTVNINETSDFRILTYTFPSSVDVGSIFYISPSFYNIGTSFAVYNYVVSANDILNYMKQQWGQSSPAVSDLDSHTSITEGFGSSVASYEDGAFISFSSAVDGAGIRGFDWSVFGGMSLFTAFVTGFYNLLPAEFALYITAVLIVGCVAVLLSAIGRVVKKGGE